MKNFGIRIDLQKLQHAFLRKFKGKTAVKRCIVIPIEDNPAIFLGEKGCYLNLTAVELGNPQFKDTHCLRGNIPNEVYENMTEEQRKSFPILGNMRPITPKAQQINGTTDMDMPEDQQDEDLPF
jgi:hypothetical protein